LEGYFEAKNYQAQPTVAYVVDLSNEWSKCGTLADESTRVLGKQGALKRGYLIGKLRLNWYGGTRK